MKSPAAKDKTPGYNSRLTIKFTADKTRQTDLMNNQAESTSLMWGCGHTAAVILSVDPLKALEQIEAYTQIDCLPCAKAKKFSASSINDVGAR